MGDLAAGTVGGAANLVVGHPFDTIKVKLQSQPTPARRSRCGPPRGPGACIRGHGRAARHCRRLERPPLRRQGPDGGRAALRVRRAAHRRPTVRRRRRRRGCRLIRCRLQAQSALAAATAAPAGVGGAAAAPAGAAVKYGGPIDVARHVLRSEGGARGLFKGLVPTLAREVPGNAIMLGVSEAAKQAMAGGPDTSRLGRGPLVVAGGRRCGSRCTRPTWSKASVVQVDDYRNPRYAGVPGRVSEDPRRRRRHGPVQGGHGAHRARQRGHVPGLRDDQVGAGVTTALLACLHRFQLSGS